MYNNYSIIKQIHNSIQSNIGLLNPYFFDKNIVISNAEIIGQNTIKITTQDAHGLDAFSDNDFLTIAGIRNCFVIDNIYIEDDYLIIETNQIHNINQANILNVEFLGFDNAIINNNTFYFNSQESKYNDNKKFKLQFINTQTLNLFKQNLDANDNEDRKIVLLLNTIGDNYNKNINRTLQRSEITIIDNNNFTYNISISETNTFISQLDYNTKSRLSYNSHIDLKNIFDYNDNADKLSTDTNYLWIEQNGIFKKDNANNVYGYLSFVFELNYSIKVFLKKDNNDWNSTIIENIINDILIIIGNTRLLDNQYFQIKYNKSQPIIDINQVVPFNNNGINTHYTYMLEFSMQLTKHISKFEYNEQSYCPNDIQIDTTYVMDVVDENNNNITIESDKQIIDINN